MRTTMSLLVDRGTWERVQEELRKQQTPELLAMKWAVLRYMFCADCGHVMYQQRYQNVGTASRTVTSAAATRSAPATVRRTLSAPTC